VDVKSVAASGSIGREKDACLLLFVREERNLSAVRFFFLSVRFVPRRFKPVSHTPKGKTGRFERQRHSTFSSMAFTRPTTLDRRCTVTTVCPYLNTFLQNIVEVVHETLSLLYGCPRASSYEVTVTSTPYATTEYRSAQKRQV